MPVAQGRSVEARAGTRVAVRHPSLTAYDTLTELDRGQVFELTGQRLDQKLVDLGYLFVLLKKDKTVQCGVCGQEFLDDATRSAHGEKRHSTRFQRPAGMRPVLPGQFPAGGEQYGPDMATFEDTEGDIESERALTDTPLYLENTTASRS